MKIYLATVAWSSSGWRGITNEKGYNDDVKKASWGYIRDSKLAHEWWNFFEDFNSNLYYGTLPVKEDQGRYEQGLIIFVSRPYNARLMKGSTRLHMIGFYFNAKKITGEILNINVPNYIHLKAKNILKTKKGKGKIELFLETSKENSTLLDEYIKFNQKDLLNGQKLGQNRFYPVDDEQVKNKLIKYLESEVLEKQNSEIVKNKLKKIIKLIKEDKKNIKSQEYLNHLIGKKQVILYGPPGTGKTYITKKIATEVLSFDI